MTTEHPEATAGTSGPEHALPLSGARAAPHGERERVR
jgi:hypothetical protein